MYPFILRVIRAIAADRWPKVLYVFLIALAAAVICPLIVVIAGLRDDGWSSIIVKLVVVIAVLIPLARPLATYRYSGRVALSSRWHCAIPIMLITAVMLLLGVFETTRPLGVLIGLIANSIAILVVGVYAFSIRLIYAITVEAPTSANVDVADADIDAKAVFRVVLAILAWEWFAALFFVAFSPQLTITIGMLAIVSLGIVALTGYSLGFKGELGQKILMYGAIAVFVGISLVMTDRLLNNDSFTGFISSGYIGRQIKNAGQPQQTVQTPQAAQAPQAAEKSAPAKKMGVFGWIFFLVLIVVVGRLGTHIAGKDKDGKDRDIICQVSVLIALILAFYLLGSWIASWQDHFLVHIGNMAKEIFMPTPAQQGTAQVGINGINIARTWYWILGAIGEGMILFSGMRRRVNPKNRKVFLPRHVPFWAMINLLLALLLFDWFWWQAGTINQICTDAQRIIGFSSNYCKNFN